MLCRKTIFLNGLLIAAALCLFPLMSNAQEPTSREYPYLYKSPRAMGMGGAYTAVGGRNDSLFYNPAGLSNIPQDKGWEVDLINVSAEWGKNSKKFYDLLSNATKTTDVNNDGSTSDEQQQAVNDVLANYRGKNLHLRVADFIAIGKSWDRFAFAIGGLGSGRLDAVAHQGFSSDGLLEVNSDVTYGGVGGFSVGLTDNFFLGVSAKAFTRDSIVHDFTAREIVDHQNDINDYFTNDLKQTGKAVGYDAGIIWRLAPNSWLRPSIGVSAMNIGGLNFKDSNGVPLSSGNIPMTINTGVAINPQQTWFRNLTIAADVVDITKKFTEDKDLAKRIRYGAELQLFDTLLAEMAVRAGMYESSPTIGADLRLLFVTVSYTMYTEEVGAYAGQDKDKRQLLTLNVGW